MYIDIAQLAAFLGVPTAVTGLFFWLLKRRIDKREDERAEIERARKELDVALIKGVNAAIALCVYSSFCAYLFAVCPEFGKSRMLQAALNVNYLSCKCSTPCFIKKSF